MSSFLSPLRYPGGKSRAIDSIVKYIPDVSEICSPFFGGGSIELYLANNGIRVYGYDIFWPLVNFWSCLIKNNNRLADVVLKKYYPLSKENFYNLQKDNRHLLCPEERLTKYKKAAIYFSLNRSSFCGTTLSGGMSLNHPRFNEASINKLKKFAIKNFNVGCEDFRDSINKHPDVFLYLDPPYLISNSLYGNKGDAHRNFDHYALFDILSKRSGWVLSYNCCEEILNMYKDYKIVYPDWKYGMSRDKRSNEVLILNY